jgi:hypothetical protein
MLDGFQEARLSPITLITGYLINEVIRHLFIFVYYLFGNNLIQNSYLAFIKPYWQIIITSYCLVLQMVYELEEKFQLFSKRQDPFMTLFLKQCRKF